MNIKLPNKVDIIINKLVSAGFEAYAVGGCIRDSLLGRTPNDWDITTSALPDDVKALFEHTVDTGIEHGTVTVIIEKEAFEVTTYRIDGEYEDKRHPKEVIFTRNLVEDLKRRDFTVNAMAYNARTGLVDVFNGASDLEKKIIRCVGNPCERFDEDALRVLRAVRFAAQLGFSVDCDTQLAMGSKAPNLADISAERIQVELVKLLVSDNPDTLKLAYDLGLTAVFLPEFDRMMETKQNNPHHMYNVGEHTLCALKAVKPEKNLRLAILFHDIGKPDTESIDDEGISHFYNHAEFSEKKANQIMRRLKFDNNSINYVKRLIRWHDYRFTLTERSMRRSLNKIGIDIFEDLMEVMRADVLAQSSYLRKEKLDELHKIHDIYNEIISSNNCITVADMEINGNDLIDLGVEKGPMIGSILNELLNMVLDEPDLNKREILIQKAKEIIDRNCI